MSIEEPIRVQAHLEPLPTVREQVRAQTGSAAGAIVKRLLLWLLVFGAAALAWWQILQLKGLSLDLLAGGAWGGADSVQWPLLIALLGIVLAVGISVLTVLATDAFSALLCAVLLFAPLAIWRAWEPLWIWWYLGPLALLILFTFLGLRSDAAGRVRWSPVGMILGTTFWVLVLIWLTGAALVTVTIAQRQDTMSPEAFRPAARQMVRWLPENMIDGIVDSLPAPQASYSAPPITVPEPAPVTVTPVSPEAMFAPPPPVPIVAPQTTIPPPAPAPFSKRSKQSAVTLPAPASPELVTPVTAVTTATTTIPPARDSGRVERLAQGLWNISSSQGEGLRGTPMLPIFAAGAMAVMLIPLLIVGLLMSLIVMGLVLWILRASEFIHVVPVRVEVMRYTLRGPRVREVEVEVIGAE